jgi:hypothetical protein
LMFGFNILQSPGVGVGNWAIGKVSSMKAIN